jgi:hypothetical protein
MKYIRTKDGRIIKFDTSDVEEEIAGIKYDILGFRLKTTMQFYNLQKEDIVKIADTIEELCDEFCLEQPLQDIEHIWFLNSAENHKEFIQRYNQSKWCEKLTSGWQKEAINGYGAIYTDKGLIYVAKLNEKGEWELL